MAKLTILGNSAALPAKNRKLSAHLFEIDGHSLLFDCGECTQFQLINFKKSLLKISKIFITHLHGDHFYGLPGLLSTMSMLNREKAIDIYGPKGLMEFLHAINEVSKSEPSFEQRIHIVDVENKQFLCEEKGFKVYAFPLFHSVASFGYLVQQKEFKLNIKKSFVHDNDIPIEWFQRIKNGEDYIDNSGTVFLNKDIAEQLHSPISYAYCTDTGYFPQIADYINAVTLLYHETTFLNSEKEDAIAKKHSTAEDAANIAKLSNANNLIIGHFSARYSDLNDFLKEASPIFPNTIIATEGLEIDL